MRFPLIRSRYLRAVAIALALIVCMAVSLGFPHVFAAPLIRDSSANSNHAGQRFAARLDSGLTDNGITEPPQGNLGGDFIIHCDNTPEAGAPVQQFDPILFNGQVAPHDHLFFGSTGVTQTATDLGLEGSSTTCKDTQDTGAEWVPALYYHHNGNPVSLQDLWTQNATGTHVYVRVYYVESVPTTDAKGYADEQFVPESLQMVAGFPAASSPPCWNCKHAPSDEEYQVLWDCGANNIVSTQMSAWPYNCNYNNQQQFDGLVGHVMFPSCWDGKGIASTAPGGNPEQPVSGPGSGSFGQPLFLSPTVPVPPGISSTFDLKYENLTTAQCPAGYQYIPRISVRVHTLITNPCPEFADSDWQDCLPGGVPGLPTTQPPDIRLMLSTMGMSGGPPTIGPWYTMHADYWNTWQQYPTTAPASAGNGKLDDNVLYCLGTGRSSTHTLPCGFVTDNHYPPQN